MTGPSTRLFAIAAAMSAGILVAEALHPALILAFGCGAAAVLMVTGAGFLNERFRGSAIAAVFVAACAFGMCLAGLRLASLERGALGVAGRAGADAILEGRVLAQPSIAGGGLRFPFGIDRARIDGRPLRVRERVLVSIRPPPSHAPDIADRLQIDARLGPVFIERSARSPSLDALARAAAQRLRWNGIAARAYVRPDAVRSMGGPRAPLDRVGRAGRRAVARPVERLPPREAGLLLGVTIGDTSRLDPGMEEDFRTTGLTHLLAVSGENLALFLGAVAFALRRSRTGRRVTLIALGFALVSFLAITRFEPSVMRAGLMATVGLSGVAIGARRETPSALAVAAIALIAMDPFIIHAIGFQLSALATLGILFLGPRLRAVLPGRVGAVLAVTIAAQLAVSPVIALTFHQLSLISLIANLLAVPAVGPATVLGIVAAPLGAVWPGLGVACVTLTRPFLLWMSFVASTFARVPHASVGTASGFMGVATVVSLLGLIVAAARVRKTPRIASLVVVIGIALSANVWAGAVAPPPFGGLEITALDVGQGDAILVRVPGASMLVDGGPDRALVLKRLGAQHVRRLDYLVLTHPHADHVEGLVAVAGRLSIGREIDAGLDANLASYREYLQTLRSKGIPRDIVRAGAHYALGAATIEVLWPADPLFSGTSSDLNNNAILMRVRYGSASALLAGEVQEEGQQRLLDSQRDALRAEVFKVPHHGSPRFLREFYAATGAAVALIPVGPNDFGHPALRFSRSSRPAPGATSLRKRSARA
ncbi:MAG: ComEC/Rec2 family competence protein [Actinobacteria bacterium]|nr:ComEC/Rec2 family competence protein [Actinomycetota bacterium]